MDMCRPTRAGIGCCVPSCSNAESQEECADADIFRAVPCGDAEECREAEEAGTPATPGTQCCVSGDGCSPPIAGPRGLVCLNGDPNPNPCNEIQTCVAVQQLRTPSTSRAGLALPNPLGTTDPTIVIGRLIRILVFASGFLSLLMFIYAGFTFLTAAGNPEKIKKGRDLMFWVIVGLTVTFGSYLVLRYIIEALVTGVANVG